MTSYSQYSKLVLFEDLQDPTETWDLVERIGEGTYGEVHMAKHKETGQIVAVKIMESIHEVVEEIEEEYQILRDLCDHPNLPTFHGIYLREDSKNEDQLWLAMELCSGGSVTDLVKALRKKKKKMDEILMAHILKETMKALEHLHKHHVMHRDVKGHNILLTAEANVKLVDFGVSGHLQSTLARRNTSVGTPFWMAPEVIACEQQLDYDYDIRCDTWSLGITAIELADGQPPLADLHPMRALFKIPRNPSPEMSNPAEWSKIFRDFISKCLVKDFMNRPHINKLMGHPFVTQVPEDTVKLKSDLVSLIRETGRIIHEPYVTTKRGRLRSRRKVKRDNPQAADDLASLEILEEDIIVSHLFNRYNKGIVYTYIGDILLAVNPFTPLTIYSDEYSRMYRNASKADSPPHIYGVADQSYQAMMHNKHNQCIVISGESGSGKTESANFLVQQLTQLGRAPNRTLEDKILQVNPLVEAFGNAKTVINDNSSRFGKYLEMTFTNCGKVTGARLSEYLLEKSRVAHQGVGERNFHIFYYIHDGLANEDKAGKYHLREHKHYRYLKNHSGNSEDISLISINRVKFKTIQKCFETIGFKSQEVSSVYSILAGILHIGNTEFTEKEVNHQTASAVKDTAITTTVADLLGVDSKELLEALTTSGMVARGETIIRANSTAEAENVRDAMAKAMYGRLFSWIVNKINHLLKPTKAKTNEDESFTIGILDIFGFENFKTNSFEQLCINIANEQIQYYFNQHIFAWEQQEYKNEGIDGSNISYVDNRPVLDMFLAKPVGLLALLDEESHFPKASDSTLVEKFHQNITSTYYIKPKSQGVTFSIEHYAGRVEYNVTDFLEKNRDRLQPEIINVLRLSQIALVRTLFHSQITKTGNLAYSTLSSNGSAMSSVISSPTSSIGSGVSVRSASNQPASNAASQSRSQQTVATYFRYSLMDLLSKMVAGTPHFVRCVRPNEENSPGYFNIEKVEIQLRYTGVLETTKIRRQGFSHRIPFSEFLKRYYILGFNWHEQVKVSRESCQLLLERLRLQNWALGKTKVFLKYYHIEELSRKFEEYNRRVVIVQSMARRWLEMNRFKKTKTAMIGGALTIQKVYRGWLVRRTYQPIIRARHHAAVYLQRGVRGYLARQKYRPLIEKRLRAAIRLQAAARGFLQRSRYKRRKNQVEASAVKIQSAFRGYQVRQKFQKQQEFRENLEKQSAVVIQKYIRMWHDRTRFRKLLESKSQQETQRIYFAQQAELYNQEMLSVMNKNNNPVQQNGTPGRQCNGNVQSPPGGKRSPTKPPRGRAPPPPTESVPPSRPLSDERRNQIKKAVLMKIPWTDSESNYYNKLNEESNVRARRKERLKQLTSAEGRSYYDNIVAEIQMRFEKNHQNGHSRDEEENHKNVSDKEIEKSTTPVSQIIRQIEEKNRINRQPSNRSGIGSSVRSSVIDEARDSNPWDMALEVAKENTLKSEKRALDEELQQQLAEVDEMFRSVLAASAACQLMANKPTSPKPSEVKACSATTTEEAQIKKSCSEQSLPWDAPLEQARGAALAPDNKTSDILEMASEVSSATPVSLDPDTNDKEPVEETTPVADEKDTKPEDCCDMDTDSSCTLDCPNDSTPPQFRYYGHPAWMTQMQLEFPVEDTFCTTKGMPVISGDSFNHKCTQSSQTKAAAIVYPRPPTPPRPKSTSSPENCEPPGDTEPPGDGFQDEDEDGDSTDKRVRFSRVETLYRSNTIDGTPPEGVVEPDSDIEDDETTYKDELIQEQEELKQQMVKSLEIQRKNSLSARFQRRAKAAVEQEKRDAKWKMIQQLSESRESNVEEEESTPVYKQILSPTAESKSLDDSSAGSSTAGEEEGEEKRGKFNFRAHLRKTYREPKSSLQKQESDEAAQIDYRQVLKKRSQEEAEDCRLSQHIPVSQ